MMPSYSHCKANEPIPNVYSPTANFSPKNLPDCRRPCQTQTKGEYSLKQFAFQQTVPQFTYQGGKLDSP